jgi:hypothetical protein
MDQEVCFAAKLRSFVMIAVEYHDYFALLGACSDIGRASP